MIYAVECDLATPARVLDWEEWYMGHVHKLIGVPGIRTAQRFRCDDWRSPYLAVYSIDNADVMDSASYHGRGGRASTGEWLALMINWHRNLFEGIGIVPEVASTQVMLVTEASSADVASAGVTLTWLENTGLDRSVGRRGMAIVETAAGGRAAAASSGRIRVYRPITQRFVSALGLG